MAEISGALYLMPQGPKTIAYYGDSTVWGLIGSDTQATYPSPYYVSVPSYTVQNLGLRGDCTLDAINGFAPINRAPWAQLMAASSAHVVIVNYGINDRNQGMTIETYKTNLRTLADAVRANNKMFVLETPNPVSIAASIPLSSYVQTMREVAAEKHVPLIDQFSYLTDLIGSSPITNYMPDGVHPNQTTYTLKGQFANQQLNVILGY